MRVAAHIMAIADRSQWHGPIASSTLGGYGLSTSISMPVLYHERRLGPANIPGLQGRPLHTGSAHSSLSAVISLSNRRVVDPVRIGPVNGAVQNGSDTAHKRSLARMCVRRAGPPTRESAPGCRFGGSWCAGSASSVWFPARWVRGLGVRPQDAGAGAPGLRGGGQSFIDELRGAAGVGCLAATHPHPGDQRPGLWSANRGRQWGQGADAFEPAVLGALLGRAVDAFVGGVDIDERHLIGPGQQRGYARPAHPGTSCAPPVNLAFFATSRGRPHRSASRITGTSPAGVIGFGSSNAAETAADVWETCISEVPC